MSDIIAKILDCIGKKLPTIIIAIVEAINNIAKCYNSHEKNKTKKDAEKYEKEFSKKIEDVTNKGTLDDLLDLKRKNK